MIKDVRVEKRRMHFRAPFKIAYETVDTADVVVVAITDDRGYTGLGCAAPDAEVTGETVAQDFKALSSKLTPEFFKHTSPEIQNLHNRIQMLFKGLPAAQSAAEEAWLNLLCLQKGIPMSALFGRPKKSARIMITIGIKNEAQTQKEVRDRIRQGFQVIKLKVGLDLKSDLIRVKAARAEIPRTCRLVLDANQGYAFEDAEIFIDNLKKLDIALLEQPVAAENREGLKALHRQSTFPIVADESVVNLEDARSLLEGDYVAGVNIKLMKCGGPINFAKITDLAKSLNKLIMIGCMYESAISITTGAHLALSLNLDYADLDSGHLDFDDDPATGGAVVERGFIRIGPPLKLKVP